jgi:hypothetical protein
MRLFKKATDIHDIEYEYGKTWKAKNEADRRLYQNAKTLLWVRVPVRYAPVAWLIWRVIVVIIYIVVVCCGSKAFWFPRKLEELNLEQPPPFDWMRDL